MIGIGAGVEIRRHRPRGRWRSGEGAEPIKYARWWHGLVGMAAGAACSDVLVIGAPGRSGQRNDAAKHIDESAGQRQVGPAGVSGNMKQNQQSLADALGSNQRRTV